MEGLNHFLRPFYCFRNEAKNHCIYPVVMCSTKSSLCKVLLNLANDISVESFFHLVKTLLVLNLLKSNISNTSDHVVAHCHTPEDTWNKTYSRVFLQNFQVSGNVI